ncbi:MAG: right-handed parallel beta-helix repeat-containing protein, partial [Paludibacteraceae bacterium]|nr:right-handed parallel beta-helix repeat-containing protein [Paludibacteraceae bacterium]
VCGKIYNNTIANNEDGALNVNNGSNLIEIVNNVMFGSDAETTGKVNVNNNANLTFNNNATIAAVTAPNATMADNIVISTDNTGSEAGVLYASFTDPATGNFLPLTGSALIDKGADIAAITMDIAGTSRPQFDKYDIGAYEVIDPSKLIPNYIMTLTVDGQGTVANGTRSWTATATDTIHEGKLQITPAVGYYIQTLSINGVAVDEPGDSYTTDDVTADINVNVVFKKYNTVTLTITGEGKVAYDGTEYTANTNFNLKDVAMTLTITPAKGFKVGSVTVNGTDVTASLVEGVYTTETLTADAAIVVKFVDEVPIVVINGPVHVKAGGTGDGSTWENAMGDIHRAIRTARADDKNRQDVWIAGGHYVIESIITLNDSISIYGGFAGTENDPSERPMVEGGKPWEYQNLTIIDGDNKTACMTANKAMEQAIVIDGVVLQNGYIEGNGGGIRTNYNVTLKNSIVRNCSAINGAGGGIQIYPAGDVYNCLIENNKQTLNANGGGGICANTSSNGYNIHIEGNTIVGNTSNIRGGAINCQGSTPYYIVGNTIYNNSAVDGDALKPGGAIYDNGQNVSEISNNLVYNNSGATAIYLKPHLFVNNTVVKNVGNVYMATTSGQNTLIRNNIVWGGATDNTGVTPTSFGGVAGTNTRIYNNAVYNPLSEDKNWDIQGNFQFSSNNSNGDVDEPTFGVGSGPKFVKPSTFIGSIDGTFSDADRAMFIAELENADWHLNYNSPCVNTGSADDDYVIDLDGIGRPQGGAFDIGCYELPYYNIVIANYDQLPGMIYTEEGIELDGGSTMSVAKGQDLVIYILANDDTPMRVTLSYSTDGGLTFDGETVDITDQVGDDGKLTIAGTQDAQISLTWNPGAGVAQTAADKYQIIGLQNEIRLAGLQQGDMIRVYNTTGQLINSMRAESLTQHISIESGLYIVRVNDATLKVLVP